MSNSWASLAEPYVAFQVVVLEVGGSNPLAHPRIFCNGRRLATWLRRPFCRRSAASNRESLGPLLERCLRSCADELTHNLALREAKNGWHGPDTTPGADSGVLGGVDLQYPDSTGVGLGEFPEDRRDLAAGRAVVSPEVDDRRNRVLENLCFERTVGHVEDFSHALPPGPTVPRVGWNLQCLVGLNQTALKEWRLGVCLIHV